VFVARDEFFGKDPVIRVSDNDGASVAVRGAEERHLFGIVECFASNSRVLVGQLHVPTAGGVAINGHYQGNVRSHKDSIQPYYGSRIRTDRGRWSVEGHTPYGYGGVSASSC